VQDDSAEEAVTELVAKPGQVAGVAAGGRTAGFDFDGEDASTAVLDDEVGFVAASFLPKVVEPWPGCAAGYLGPDLGEDEGVESAAEKPPSDMSPALLRRRAASASPAWTK
jgi:hypothetical protein